MFSRTLRIGLLPLGRLELSQKVLLWCLAVFFFIGATGSVIRVGGVDTNGTSVVPGAAWLDISVMATAAIKRAFTAVFSAVFGSSVVDETGLNFCEGTSSALESLGDSSEDVSDGMEPISPS